MFFFCFLPPRSVFLVVYTMSRFSPTEGPCCSRDCKFKSATNGDVCRQASDCSLERRCDGRQAICPQSDPKPDNTLCQENTKVCNAGVKKTN